MPKGMKNQYKDRERPSSLMNIISNLAKLLLSNGKNK